MKAIIFRVIGVMGFILALGSLSACFEETSYPRYGYNRPAYASPQYYPEYVPVPYNRPAPRYYVYNPRPYVARPHPYRGHGEQWEHEEHKEHAHGHHHDDRF